jgi:hypothetical protein
MSRMKVHVGVVFTQAMICDPKGKIHYHKVMTDVDKPWVSVIEAITELMPKKPIPTCNPLDSLDIRINFTNVHHSPQSILEQLHYPEIHSSDIEFQFEEQKEVESLIRFIGRDMDETILDSVILSELMDRMVISEMGKEKPTDLKEIFHQQLARLYEGGFVWSASMWEEDLVAVNTS